MSRTEHGATMGDGARPTSGAESSDDGAPPEPAPSPGALVVDGVLIGAFTGLFACVALLAVCAAVEVASGSAAVPALVVGVPVVAGVALSVGSAVRRAQPRLFVPMGIAVALVAVGFGLWLR